MSKEIIVLLVDDPGDQQDIDDAAAKVFMRFTEPPEEDFLQRLAQANPGKRVYCLTGASTWHSFNPPGTQPDELGPDTTWHPIESAPKDGMRVWVKRMFKGRIVQEGWAVWGINSADAPIRGVAGNYGDEERWLTPDRRFSFPTPTHWKRPTTAAERLP